MAEVDEFLGSVLPRLHEMEMAFHSGDVGPRFATWSHNDPVTLFGARLSGSGWTKIAPAFEWVAAKFSKGESYEYEVISAGASGDLAYIVGYEHTKAAVGSGPPEAYELRVTTIFRREDGEWKVIHRHADPMLDSDSAQRHWARFDETGPESALTP